MNTTDDTTVRDVLQRQATYEICLGVVGLAVNSYLLVILILSRQSLNQAYHVLCANIQTADILKCFTLLSVGIHKVLYLNRYPTGEFAIKNQFTVYTFWLSIYFTSLMFFIGICIDMFQRYGKPELKLIDSRPKWRQYCTAVWICYGIWFTAALVTIGFWQNTIIASFAMILFGVICFQWIMFFWLSISIAATVFGKAKRAMVPVPNCRLTEKDLRRLRATGKNMTLTVILISLVATMAIGCFLSFIIIMIKFLFVADQENCGCIQESGFFGTLSCKDTGSCWVFLESRILVIASFIAIIQIASLANPLLCVCRNWYYFDAVKKTFQIICLRLRLAF